MVHCLLEISPGLDLQIRHGRVHMIIPKKGLQRIARTTLAWMMPWLPLSAVVRLFFPLEDATCEPNVLGTLQGCKMQHGWAWLLRQLYGVHLPCMCISRHHPWSFDETNSHLLQQHLHSLLLMIILRKLSSHRQVKKQPAILKRQCLLPLIPLKHIRPIPIPFAQWYTMLMIPLIPRDIQVTTAIMTCSPIFLICRGDKCLDPLTTAMPPVQATRCIITSRHMGIIAIMKKKWLYQHHHPSTRYLSLPIHMMAQKSNLGSLVVRMKDAVPYIHNKSNSFSPDPPSPPILSQFYYTTNPSASFVLSGSG